MYYSAELPRTAKITVHIEEQLAFRHDSQLFLHVNHVTDYSMQTAAKINYLEIFSYLLLQTMEYSSALPRTSEITFHMEEQLAFRHDRHNTFTLKVVRIAF